MLKQQLFGRNSTKTRTVNVLFGGSGVNSLKTSPGINRILVPSVQNQVVVHSRNLQTKLPFHVGFFDDLAGTYKTLQNPPNFTKAFKLSMKPFEFRQGQPFWYFNFAGILVTSFSIAFGFMYLMYFVVWYFYSNPFVTTPFSLYNPHPFLEIRNGRDMSKTVDPLSKLYVYWSPARAEDKKTLFYRELNLAKKHQL